MKNKTIKDAVRELDGNWNKAVNSSLPDFTCLWFREYHDNKWWTLPANGLMIAEGYIVCTKEQFEEAAKKYHKEKVQPYIPQSGDWFLLAHKNDETFLKHKYFCVGRSTHGGVVFEDNNGNMLVNNTENYKFKQAFFTAEEEWKIRAYALLGLASEPKDVVHEIYQALVSGKLSIPK